jgi:hypothetical protein
MRSRPNVELWLRPQPSSPGDTVEFDLMLHGRSQTPVDAVVVRVSGLERRMVGRAVLQHEHLSLVSTFEGMTLGADEHRVLRGKFTLPEGLPPSFTSTGTSITYLLEARVDIPWWPDRVVTWEVEVLPPPTTPKSKTAFISNLPVGPRGTELALEVSLQDTELTAGAVLEGAVAATNLEGHRVTGLTVGLSARDEPVVEGGWGSAEHLGYPPLNLCDGPPRDGVSYPFRIPIPADAMPSFQGAHSRLMWLVEARAVRRLGSDVVAAKELRVHPAATRRAKAPAALPRQAPMGSERRALIWAQVARQHGLATDAQEKMTGTCGAVALSITLELRGGALWSVASLDWADLRLGAHLSERRLFDGFTPRLETGDAAFDHRFTARARDAQQLGALMGAAVKEALLAFERVTLDDEGAMLASLGNGYTVYELDRFVTAALKAARALDAAVGAVPPPAGLEGCRASWAAAARAHGGVFSPGDLSIRGASFKGDTVELLTRFDAQGKPNATVARVKLSAAPQQPLPSEAQRVLSSISAEVEGVRVERDAVEATLPCPLTELDRAERLWRTLQRLAAALK